MKLTLLIGFLTVSLQWKQTYQQNVVWNENFNGNVGTALDYYNGMIPFINPYFDYATVLNYYDAADPNILAPSVIMTDQIIPQISTVERSSHSEPFNSYMKESVQPIFKLFERPAIKNKQNNIDIMNSASNGLSLPHILPYQFDQLYPFGGFEPPYSFYGLPYRFVDVPQFGGFEPQYSLYGIPYSYVEIPQYNLPFFTSGVNYIDLNEIGQKNPSQNTIYLPNRIIGTSQDDTYKATLKSVTTVSGGDQNVNNRNPIRHFRTNFSGDISKCDMICKCRNIFVKPTGSTPPPPPPPTPLSASRKNIYK